MLETFSLGGLGTVEVPREMIQLFIAAVIGLIIGIERAYRGKAASLRTFSMISSGSCLFSILSVEVAEATTGHTDIARIAAQVVSGVGFIGGGVIFKHHDRIEGLTSAAMIWFTAAIGMACGFDHVPLAIAGSLCWLFIHVTAYYLHRLVARLRLRRRLKGQSPPTLPTEPPVKPYNSLPRSP